MQLYITIQKNTNNLRYLLYKYIFLYIHYDTYQALSFKSRNFQI
jgi:hypothetical protein